MILKLNKIDVLCVIGDRADERVRQQHLLIDVEMALPDTASRTDELRDTVDYAALTEAIRDTLVSAKCRMIERAARLVLEAVPKSVVWARVTVTKKGAIDALESASVVLERSDK